MKTDRAAVTIRDVQTLQVLAHPTRVRILEALRSEMSPAAVARTLGEPRQRVHYHLKELAKVGLVRQVGERRSGNLMETLYRAAGTTFLIAPEVAWADPRRTAALKDQLSLENLVQIGGQLQTDAAMLLDRAAFDGERIATAAMTADLRFPDEGARAAFLEDYLVSMRSLIDRHAAKEGEPFRVVLAAHPTTDSEEETP
jgi:DNA-binding transcriptional ArsR family regulator